MLVVLLCLIYSLVAQKSCTWYCQKIQRYWIKMKVCRCVEKETMMYVPILCTLDVVLQNETMAEVRDT